MIFLEPAWLFALLLLPVSAGLFAWLADRDRDRLSLLVARPLWSRVVRAPRQGFRLARVTLLLVSACGIVLALARPQWGIVREKVEREGVDVVLLLDTSASMATADVAPSRFFLARQALLQLMSRLQGDRFALVAFEGEAYPLVPLTLDADALGLFLETVEPGIVPAPGTSLGVGLAKGLEAFVDKERRNKVMVLVSDGEDLEGEVEQAVRRAKEAGVVVHTVAVGTEAGQPVPEMDANGRVTGYKRDAGGNPVVSRLDARTLEAIAAGTGGQAFRITAQDTSLARLASAIEGMEQKALAREYSYRRKEQFQVPLAAGIACLAAALLLPPPRLRRRETRRVSRETVSRAAALGLLLAVAATPSEARDPAAPPAPGPAAASSAPSDEARPSGNAAASSEQPQPRGSALDEILLRAKRATGEGRVQYGKGNHPQALSAFERAAKVRPSDPAVRFNVADGLYKNGRYDEAAALYKALGADERSLLAAPSRFNLGNTLYQQKDFAGAVKAYREALRAAPGDQDTRRNLELALRALAQQQEQQKRQQDQKQRQQQDEQQRQDQKHDQKRDQNDKQDQKRQGPQQQDQQQPGEQKKQPQSAEEKADQRFREETGMPRERAMQLLDALQQNEKAEQKKLLAEKRAQRKRGRDW